MTCISIIPRIWLRTHIKDFTAGSVAANIYYQYTFWIHISNLFPSHICSHTMRSLGCQHTDVVFNIKHTVADGISNGNANGPFRNDFTSPVYLLCIIFLEVSTIFLFNHEKREIEKRTKMKTCMNISFPSKVRFRKRVHSQASDHVFLNLFSKRPREKK